MSSSNATETKKYESKLPKVPSKDDQPIYGLKSSKNYVTANAVEAILQVPKQLPQEPNYLLKEDYGKVPSYLNGIRSEIDREREMIQKYVDQRLGNVDNDGPEEYVEELAEEERAALVRALKLKWENTNALYQKFTHLVSLDTIGKIRRKEMLESELKTIEKDILRLERAKRILIS